MTGRPAPPHPDSLASRPPLLLAALGGFVAALFGTYWDDAWHTEVGRDTFFIAPHLVLYAGISLAGGALTVWLALNVRRVGLRAALERRSLLLALAGVALTLIAAPIDNAWHQAFGRDAVLWSPPHMLGVGGSVMIAAALLLELANEVGRSLRWTLAGLTAAAALLAVCAIPVLEYETDVPQFDPLFYLPVLGTGVAFALGLIRAVVPLRYAATAAAVGYAVVSVIMAIALAIGGMPLPLLPLVLVPALALDLSSSRGAIVQAMAFSAALYATYVPYVNWVRSDLFVDGADIALGLPLTLLGTMVALATTQAGSGAAGPRRRAAGRALAATAALALLLPASAGAHDPGQGDELTEAAVRAEITDGRATIEVTPRSHCDDLTERNVRARRAGTSLEAELFRTGPCRFEGAIDLTERGRWFLYAELDHRGEQVETWIAVEDGSGPVSDADRSLYAPAEVEASGVKVSAGIALYAVTLAALALTARLYRRSLDGPAPGD